MIKHNLSSLPPAVPDTVSPLLHIPPSSLSLLWTSPEHLSLACLAPPPEHLTAVVPVMSPFADLFYPCYSQSKLQHLHLYHLCLLSSQHLCLLHLHLSSLETCVNPCPLLTVHPSSCHHPPFVGPLSPPSIYLMWYLLDHLSSQPMSVPEYTPE